MKEEKEGREETEERRKKRGEYVMREKNGKREGRNGGKTIVKRVER